MITIDNEVSRELVDDIRGEWKLLWNDSIDDKVRAEGLANKNFSLLFIERGTVIKATRDFKEIDLREIVRLHGAQNVERVLGPCPSEGGWTKFAKTVLNKQSRNRMFKEELLKPKPKKNMQQKQSGRGWLHK